MPGLAVLGNTQQGCSSCAGAGYSVPRRSTLLRHARVAYSHACGCGCGGSCSRCRRRFQDGVKTLMHLMPYGINIPANLVNLSHQGLIDQPLHTLQGLGQTEGPTDADQEQQDEAKKIWEAIKLAWQFLSGDECKRKCDFKYFLSQTKRRTCKCLCAKLTSSQYTPPDGKDCWKDYGVDVEGNQDGLTAPEGKQSAPIMYFGEPFGGYAAYGTEVRITVPIDTAVNSTVFVNSGPYQGNHKVQAIASEGGVVKWIFIDTPFKHNAAGVTKSGAGTPILYPPKGTALATVPFSELPPDAPGAGKKTGNLALVALAALALSQS